MCVSYTSVSPKDNCKPGSTNEPIIIRAFKKDCFSDLSFYYGKLENPIVSFMPMLVYEILQNGTYHLSSSSIGLDNLDKEFCSDPDVISILRKYGLSNQRL